MNLKVTKNIQQLVAQRRAKKIETVRNEVITVNLKEARAKLAEATGTKQADSPTTPPPVDADVSSWEWVNPACIDCDPVDADVAPVTDAIFATAKHAQQIVEKPEDTPQAPEHATASLSPLGDDSPAPAPVDADVSSGTGTESVDASTFFKAFVDTADVSSGTGIESVGSPIPPESVDTADVSVKKPTRSRSRSKSKSKK